MKESAASIWESLRDADLLFAGKGPTWDTLRRLTDRLDSGGISYAVIGGLALFLHGLRRFTRDFSLLVTPTGLTRFRDTWVGEAYRPATEGATRTFVDAVSSLQFGFVLAGEFPGDGLPKPVVWPDPACAAVEISDYRVVSLEKLVETKLASGLNAPHRLRDLADIQELIAHIAPPLDLAESLDPNVRHEYRRLWRLVDEASPDPHEQGPRNGR